MTGADRIAGGSTTPNYGFSYKGKPDNQLIDGSGTDTTSKVAEPIGKDGKSSGFSAADAAVIDQAGDGDGITTTKEVEDYLKKLQYNNQQISEALTAFNNAILKANKGKTVTQYNDDGTTTELKLNGAGKTVSSVTYDSQNRQIASADYSKHIFSTTKYNDDGTSTTITDYKSSNKDDAKIKKTVITKTAADGSKTVSTEQYNSKTKTTLTEEEFAPGASKPSKTTISVTNGDKYTQTVKDDQGRLIEKSTSTSKNSSTERVTKKYNDDGSVETTTVKTNAKGGLTVSTTEVKSKNGLLLSKTTLDGKTEKYTYYSDDAKAKVKTSTIFENDVETLTEYNRSGKKTKTTETFAGGDVKVTDYASNGKIKKTVTTDYAGNVTTDTYSNGRKTKSITKDSNGNITKKETYDSKGNIKESYEYDNLGGIWNGSAKYVMTKAGLKPTIVYENGVKYNVKYADNGSVFQKTKAK